MIHKGIEYYLTATSEPDIWQWRFQIGNSIKTGKTQTRLPALAERRVQLKIDATLKAMSNALVHASAVHPSVMKLIAVEASAKGY